MMDQAQPTRIFNLNVAFENPLQNKLFSLMKGSIEHALDFPRLNRFYDDVSRLHDNRPFPDKVLEQLNVSYDVSEADLSRVMIPEGPVVVSPIPPCEMPLSHSHDLVHHNSDTGESENKRKQRRGIECVGELPREIADPGG